MQLKLYKKIKLLVCFLWHFLIILIILHALQMGSHVVAEALISCDRNQQTVLMLARPWQKPFFLFMKRKTHSQESWIERSGAGSGHDAREHAFTDTSNLLFYSRHDESLLPRLSEHPVHKQGRVGEAVFVPLPSFVEAQPGNTNSCFTRGRC